MSRHLSDCHRTESEVEEILILPLKSAERHQKFEHLMCVGDYYHNVSVLQSGHGQLIVLRRPTEQEYKFRDIHPRDYTPCPGCLGFVNRSHLWRHASRCKDVDHEYHRERGSTLQASRLLIFPIESEVSQEYMKEVVGRMVVDNFSDAATTDWLITQLGLFMFKQYGKCQRQLISTRMRMLGHLLFELRRLTENTNLTFMECISPDYMDLIVEAIHGLCRVECSRSARPTMH